MFACSQRASRGYFLPHPWIPNSAPEIKERMMKELGIESIDELFSDIPAKYKLNRLLNVGLGRPLSEYEVKKVFKEKLGKIAKLDNAPFLGGEYCVHYVPEVVKLVLRRDEFYTAYTPYQPEINQGILQALFEYQSLMAELYGVEVVNASMYDGSTALAEAIRMALRITRRRKIVISRGIGPLKLDVIRTWLRGLDVEISEVSLSQEDGTTSYESLEDLVDSRTAAVVISNPTFYGSIERRVDDIAGLVHSRGALFIVFSDPISLGVLKAPGDYGADIVVGEGQPLGLGVYYGGFTLGILGTRREMRFVRQLPGRLVGLAPTIGGRDRGFALVLQTREQHIRRERATSNITTNSALTAIAAAAYVMYMGGEGIRRLSRSILARTVYFLGKVRAELKGKASPLFARASYFKQVPVAFPGHDYNEVFKKLLEHGIVGGTPLGRYDSSFNNVGLFCFTEMHSRSLIDDLVRVLKEVLG